MNKRSPVTIILLGGGLLISAHAALLGAGGLFYGISTYPAQAEYGDVMLLVFTAGTGLVSLIAGLVGVGWCIDRISVLRRKH